MIGYAGALHYSDNYRNEELRKVTFNDIQKFVPSEVYRELTQSSPYRATVATNPESLEQHMPFYTIRMGYLWTMSATSKIFQIPVAQATYWVASFFAGLCVLVLGLMFNLSQLWWLLLFPLALHLAGLTEVASLSTPDSMAAFFALTAWYLYQKNRRWWTLLPLTLLPLVRTDFIIIAGILGIFSFLNKRQVQAVLYFVLPALMYIYVNKVNANYGYLKIFNFTLIGIDPFPATMHIQTTLMPYLNAYAEGFGAFVGHKHFILFTLYGLCWFKYIRPQKKSLLNQQVGLVLGFVLFHMLLFPAYYQRFFAWCAAIAGLQLATWIYEIRGAHRIRKSSAIPFSEKTL
ncbi:MAG: hypothetical protein HUU57_10090 [Bdellovibrio sp.]|nr:hypothetical protein [Bdellovibrio sp.]